MPAPVSIEKRSRATVDDVFSSFAVAPQLSTRQGFFRLGQTAVGYGRCKGTPAQDSCSAQYDAIEDVRIEGEIVELPFDPKEVLQNLRMERYAGNSAGTQKNLLYHAYYAMRPLMPVWFRRHLQKIRLQQSRNLPFPQWPVDFTVENIEDTLLQIALRSQNRMEAPFVWYWPQGYPACAIVTHDVETDKGLAFCPQLMDLNDSFGVKSSFQLIPEKRYTVTDQVLETFRERSFEVNVHDLNHDGHLYSSREEFLRRVKKINSYARAFDAKGFRSGAMYRNLDWYDEFEFSYDMSVPNVGHLEAQGGGCCSVRPYFIGNIVELPLTTIQDYSLFQILGEYSIDLWKRQIHAILERNGLISFIVHPDYIIEKKARDTYTALLDYLSQLREEGKLWIARPGEVAQWWRQRSQMSLVEDGPDSWQIEGNLGDRARIGKAVVRETGISYEVVSSLKGGFVS